MEQLRSFLRLLRESKGKIFLMIVSALVFAFLIFPFDDLTDLISSQVSKLSRNQVYLQFDSMNVSVIPSPGVSMESVYIETARFPGLTAKELSISPSISGLIRQQPLGSISAKGLLQGDVDIRVSPASKTESGVERQKFEVTAKQVSLGDIRELANLPILLKGKINLQTTAITDLAFQEQPDVEIDLVIQQFELPPSNVETMMGPLTLPDLRLTSVELRGRLAAGRFVIENGTLGKPGDDLHGTIKGNIVLNLINRGGQIIPQAGAYNFDIDLRAKKSLQDRAALFLSFIDSYKTATPEGAQYKFRVSATNPMMPPNIGNVR